MGKRKYGVVSLFCGCGGLDIGFERAGFSVEAAYDIDKVAVETYNNNLNGQATVADIAADGFDIPRGIDVLLSGSPCQGFSLAGKRQQDDPRNRLLGLACSLAVKSRPKVLVIENVPGALAGDLKSTWDSAVESLLAAGYAVRYEIVSLHQFGIPQMRRRVFLVATMGPRFPSFSTSFPGTQLKSLRDALKGVHGVDSQELVRSFSVGSADWLIATRIGPGQKLCDVRAGGRSVHSWAIPEVFGKTTASDRELLQLILRLRRQVRRRKTGDADPVELDVLKAHAPKSLLRRLSILESQEYLTVDNGAVDLKRRFNGKYRRLSWNSLSYTVDTNFGNPRYFLHPEEHRGLTVREAARIQGFDDSFSFSGTINDRFRLIGNAVPPPAAEAFANFVRGVL